MTTIPCYDVYAIRYGEQLERPEGSTYMGGDPSKMIRGLDFFIYIIRGENKTYIVDTGFNPDLSGEGGRHFLEQPSEIISKLGIDSKAIDHVLLTHAHFDHVGNLDSYPNANFSIHVEEMNSITGPDMKFAPFKLAYHARDTRRLVELLYEERLSFYEGLVNHVAPGIELHLIGGHSRGQMALRVNTKRGWIVLASDAVHLYDEVELERPFAIFHDLQKMIEGYRTCLKLAGTQDYLISGHDPKVTDWYPALAPEFNGRVLDLGKTPNCD